MPELDERIVAIAGAAGGLGPSVCRTLAGAGASLALTDVAQDRLDSLVAELGVPAERVDARVVDLLDEDATRAWAAALAERFGKVDALCHLVGGWRERDPIAQTSLDHYAW